MYTKKPFGERLFDVFNMFFFIVFCASILFPFYQILVNSLSTEETILTYKGFFPRELFLGNWSTVFHSNLIWISFLNTVLVTAGSCMYSLFLSITYGYALSRKSLPFRDLWTGVMLFTMFFSGGLIPYYLLIKQIGLVDTRWALILGSLNAFNTIILRNFFMSIPDELQESAKMDGANEFRILTGIVLPLSMPAIATITLWIGVVAWNSWFGALIYIVDPKKQVLQVVLKKLISESTFNLSSMNDPSRAMEEIDRLSRNKGTTSEGLMAATMLFVIAPIMMSYPFAQKYFVKGILIGSLKG